MKRIIINADDFGITRGVTDAILDCHRSGSLGSTTLMVNMGASEYAAEHAVQTPSLGVGLHFNLTLGRPISSATKVASLLDENQEFRHRRSQERALLFGKVAAKEIRMELLAQYEKMLELGVEPTHIDSHQHIHMMPKVFDAVLQLAKEKSLPLRMPWLTYGVRSGLKNKVKSLALTWLLRSNRKKIGSEVKSNQCFCSAFDLSHDPGVLTLESYRHLLQPMQDMTELMVHPAIVDEQLERLIRISAMGAFEYELMTRQSFSAMITELGFEQCTYEVIRV